MVKTIIFLVYGNPVAQPRPRAFKIKTGKIGVYDPKNAKEWKELVKLQAIKYRPPELLDQAISVWVNFSLLRPKSAPKKRKWPTKRPDLENLAKSIMDALKNVIYRDDSQIIDLYLTKRYCIDNQQPSVMIRIEQVL